MKNIVKIRNVVFGEGIPKICIPLTDADIEELSKSVNELKSAPFDMVEWRADFFNDIEDPQKRFQAMSFLREQLGNTPILFTARTSVEGGKLDIDTEGHVKLLTSVIDTGLMDLVDVELSRGEDAMKTIRDAAHKQGCILSVPSMTLLPLRLRSGLYIISVRCRNSARISSSMPLPLSAPEMY